MVEQQVFERLGLGRLHLFAVGDDNHAVLDRRLAAGDELGHHRDRAVGLFLARLDQAHAATGDDRQGRMPAVVRDFDAGALGRPESRSGARSSPISTGVAVYEDGPHQFLTR